MSDSLISRAMREIAKRRMEKLTAEQRQKIASKGGKAWWDKLSEEERRIAIERIQKARKKKHAPIAESNIPLKTQTSRRAKTVKPKA